MSGKRITDQKILATDKCWVLLRYADGSEFCFQTTLCASILNSLGIQLEEGKLVRLDKQYYIGGKLQYKQFPFQGAKISLWTALTYTNEKSFRLHDFL